MKPLQCRFFRVRVPAGFTVHDDPTLNAFLADVRVENVFALPAREDSESWEILVFYRESGLAAGEEVTGREIEKQAECEGRVAEPVEYSLPLTAEETATYERLRAWRNEQAQKEGFPVYVVAHNKCLKEMARLHVRTLDDLARVKGFGPKRIEKYGDAILAVLREE